MRTVDRLAALLPKSAAGRLLGCRDALREIRLRVGQQPQLVCDGGDALVGEPVTAELLGRVLSALMDHSLHTREAELAQGYFTLSDGSRVGVCGRVTPGAEQRMPDIGSICVRVARQIPGCADGLMEAILDENRPRSVLVVSPPGMGKTTLLRDVARQLSTRGYNVGVADERHEIAACWRGVPTLDLGPRTDVMDGCPKAVAIGRLLRAMGPDVLITDELGGEGDAEAIADAARCGVAVIASAHGADLTALYRRNRLKSILEKGVFDYAAMLGSRVGEISRIQSLAAEGRTASCRRA